MRLEDLRAELRPRTNWEAMDLGLRMLREWWRPVFAAWFCVVIPVFLVGFGMTWWAPWLGAFLIWCAQPLWGPGCAACALPRPLWRAAHPL